MSTPAPPATPKESIAQKVLDRIAADVHAGLKAAPEYEQLVEEVAQMVRGVLGI